MKRKRANGKWKPKKPSVGGEDEPFNTSNHSGLNDFNSGQFDSRMEARTQQNKCSKGGPRAGLKERGAVNDRVEDCADSLPETVTSNPCKAARTISTRSSRRMGSSITNLSNCAILLQRLQKEANTPQQDPRYKELELNAALAVIKKVMQMNAAGPFNVPVDPIALGISDYFDVIDTPMDFGTICSNLENGIKYLNSKDVFEDVQYIWENCSKYNMKGHYVLELMKQVKKNFTKYWTAAGLYSEPPGGINVMAQTKKARGRTILDFLQSESHQEPEAQVQVQPQAQSHHYTRAQAQAQAQIQAQVQVQAQSQVQVQPQDYTHSTGTGPQLETSQSTQLDGTSVTGSTSTKRRGRGIAKGLKTWGTDQKLHLEFNDLGQAIGKSSTQLATHIGIMVRNGEQVPLHYTRWDDIPEHALDYIWTEVKDNTDAPPEFRDNCLSVAGALWRRWKSQVKHDYYNKYDTDEERLLNRPDRVQPDQWEALVIYWGNEKTKEIARINKRNREHQVLNHTTGRKKHAQMEVNGKDTDRMNVFIETHKPKEGRQQAPETAAVIAEMTSRLNTVPEEERTTSFKEKVFTDVVGPDVRSRVKTYGAGATMRVVFGTEVGTQTRSKDMEMEQRIVEKVSAGFASLLDSRIAEVINLFRSEIEEASRRIGDGPSSVGN